MVGFFGPETPFSKFSHSMGFNIRGRIVKRDVIGKDFLFIL